MAITLQTKEKMYIHYLRAWVATKAATAAGTRDEVDLQTAIALGTADAKSQMAGPRTINDVENEVKRLLAVSA